MDAGLILRGVAVVAAIAFGRVVMRSSGGRQVAAIIGTVVSVAVFVVASLLVVR